MSKSDGLDSKKLPNLKDWIPKNFQIFKSEGLDSEKFSNLKVWTLKSDKTFGKI